MLRRSCATGNRAKLRGNWVIAFDVNVPDPRLGMASLSLARLAFARRVAHLCFPCQDDDVTPGLSQVYAQRCCPGGLAPAGISCSATVPRQTRSPVFRILRTRKFIFLLTAQAETAEGRPYSSRAHGPLRDR